tara:strand:+ start:230 stop:430 length:201 start_codon:yes stop_codon:yes gene_type:complete
MPFFCEPSEIISDWCWEMIEDYNIVKNYKVPLADNLDSVDMWRLDCFKIIESEVNNINTHKAKENG